MNNDSVGSPTRLVRSPAVGPTRPISIQQLSEEFQTYVELYGLGQDEDRGFGESSLHEPLADGGRTQDFLFSGDMDEELKSLQNLRRISLDVSNLDPDLPTQNYELKPSLTPAESDTDTTDTSLYWVPARIHPELAPQEWQSFVQKRSQLAGDELPASGLFRAPSMKRGLSRSRSLLSREISDRGLDQYRDAGPDLERRRSKLHSQIKVADLENVNMQQRDTALGLGQLPNTQHGPENSISDEPILVPPPGQILRRAARTGKAKGSYRRLAKTRIPSDESIAASAEPGTSGKFESETIQLRDDAPGYQESQRTPRLEPSEAEPAKPLERTKSRNRTIQIVGTKTLEESIVVDEELLRSLSLIDERALPLDIVVSNSIPDDGKNISIEQSDVVDDTQRALSVKTDEGLTRAKSYDNTESSPMESANEPGSRPGLKRELSAASLTRAVMGGTAPSPVAATKQAPHRHNTQEELAVDTPTAVSSSKKSAWGKLFSSEEKVKVKKDPKANSKVKRTPSQEDRTTHEKDSNNLFTSLFGVKKKEKEVVSETVRRGSTQATKPPVREAQAFSRYPIQLERAIYRMAHLKLGNSRRPLFHQVLLSNFMYGYLALVGANTSGQAQGPSAGRKNRPQNNAQRSASLSSESSASEESTRTDPRPGTSNKSQQASKHRPDSTARPASNGTFAAPVPATENQNSKWTNLATDHTSGEVGNEHMKDASKPVANPPRMQRPGPVRRAGSMDVNEAHQRSETSYQPGFAI